jgi:hypothetical protein
VDVTSTIVGAYKNDNNNEVQNFGYIMNMFNIQGVE